MIKILDVHTIKILLEKIPSLVNMYKAITSTLNDGNKVYINGCGATGRLALSLEAMWR